MWRGSQYLKLTSRRRATNLEQLVWGLELGDGWTGSFGRWQLAGEGHAAWPCVRGVHRYYLGISTEGNASDRHKGPSGRLWETRAEVLREDGASPPFLRPLNLVVPPLLVTCYQILGPGPENRETEAARRKCLALLMDGRAFLLRVLISWPHFLPTSHSSLGSLLSLPLHKRDLS